MIVTKEIHEDWLLYKSMPEELQKHFSPFFKQSLIQKYEYHYKNKNGEIGIIRINLPSLRINHKKKLLPFESYHEYVWEACGVLEYNRFKTRHEAEIAIFEALGEDAPKEKLVVK